MYLYFAKAYCVVPKQKTNEWLYQKNSRLIRIKDYVPLFWKGLLRSMYLLKQKINEWKLQEAEKKMSSIYFVYNIAMCDITFPNKNPAVQCTICSKVLVFFSKFQIHCRFSSHYYEMILVLMSNDIIYTFKD